MDMDMFLCIYVFIYLHNSFDNQRIEINKNDFLLCFDRLSFPKTLFLLQIQ